MTRTNGIQGRDHLLRDAERRSLAAFSFDPSRIAASGASVNWYRDPAYQAMFVGLDLFAKSNPSAQFVSGEELAIFLQQSSTTSGLLKCDDDSRIDQFSPREFNLATEDGFTAVDRIESYVRLLRDDSDRREIIERLAEVTSNGADATTIRTGLREILASSSDAGDRVLPVGVQDISPFGQLASRHECLRPPVIDELLRQGEICNFIAKSKVGKSWGTYGLALSIATGGRWLERFRCAPGRVLLIDNELHKEVLASRIRTVGEAMELQPEQYANSLDVLSLRGRLTPIDGLGPVLRSIERQCYSLIILDALYRMLPEGASENDNAGMAQVYNHLVDRYAEITGAAFVLVHHASKGSQSEKDVTDVGAGAGAQSRAADTHLVLRPHEEEGCIVLDAAVRSFAPIDSVVLRWDFPLWKVAAGLDPAKLKLNPVRSARRQQVDDHKGIDKIVASLRKTGAATASQLRTDTGMGPARVKRLVKAMVEDGRLEESGTTVYGNRTSQYSLAPSLRGACTPVTLSATEGVVRTTS